MELALPKNDRKKYYIGDTAKTLWKNASFVFFSDLSKEEVQRKIRTKFPKIGKIVLKNGKHKVEEEENKIISLPTIMKLYSYQEDIAFAIYGCKDLLKEESSFMVENIVKNDIYDFQPCYFVRMTEKSVPAEYVVSRLKANSILGDNFIIFKDYLKASLFVRTFAKKSLYILIKRREKTEWEKCSKEDFRGMLLNNPVIFEDYEYQTFGKKSQMESFIGEYKESLNVATNGYEIFVDGSCVPSRKKYSWAFVVYYKGQEIYFDKGHEEREQHLKHGSQVGEFLAMIHAVNYVLETGIKNVVINYDNINNFNCMNSLIIHKETDIFAKYYDFMKEKNRILQKRGVNIAYQHVKAHSGNKGNERADLLAKRAIKEADYFF